MSDKILLFTTSYCKDIQEWTDRILKWYNYLQNKKLFYNKLLILDDGSNLLPAWKNIPTLTKKFEEEPIYNSFIYSFKHNLGRPSHLDYPGWFRSFSFAARYALKFNYTKVIHIESDAYLISSKIIDYTNNLSSGWTSLWCNKHFFPETAIQIICKDQIKNFYNITQLSYDKFFKNKTIETCLPFTHIEKSYVGDRYHEYREDIPGNADYACQVKNNYIL